MPLVSLLCVTYNQREFVTDAVRGMVAQDYPNLEIIVADDGSTDGTVERLRELAAETSRRIVVVAGEHAGITANSNRGLAQCLGTYVAVMGGDDVMLPGKISRQVEWMEAGGRRVLCGHDVDVFDSATGRTIYLWSDRFPLEKGIGAEKAVQSVPFCAAAIMVRRSAIPEYGFDPRVPVASDLKCWIDCLHPDGEYGYVEGVLSRYRRHDRNVTGADDLGKMERGLVQELIIWDLVARDYPALAPACADARSDAFHEAAKSYRSHGHTLQAIGYVLRSLRARPLHFLSRYVVHASRRLHSRVRGRLRRHSH
jgi:glycosyltransferase involved in cell wall biosynthesis